jgi:hypothetical protein
MTKTRSKNKRNKRSHTKRRQRGGAVYNDIKKIGAYTGHIITSGVVIPANLLKQFEHLTQFSKEVLNRLQMIITYNNKMKKITLQTSERATQIKSNYAKIAKEKEFELKTEKNKLFLNQTIRKARLNSKKNTAKINRETKNINNQIKLYDLKHIHDANDNIKKHYKVLFDEFIMNINDLNCSTTTRYIYKSKKCSDDKIFEAYKKSILNKFKEALLDIKSLEKFFKPEHVIYYGKTCSKILEHNSLLKSLPSGGNLDKSSIESNLILRASASDETFFNILDKSYEQLKEKQTKLIPHKDIKPMLDIIESNNPLSNSLANPILNINQPNNQTTKQTTNQTTKQPTNQLSNSLENSTANSIDNIVLNN